jgi:spermidine synthase
MTAKKYFCEKWSKGIKFCVEYNKHIYSAQTKFQKLDFYQSDELGTFFTLDDVMMANQKDEFIYHEMMIHTPMSVNPKIKKVLVIGGGDGGSVRELTKYSSIKQIDMVEIDEEVVKKCIKFLPQTASKLKDKRVKLFFEDGLAYVKNAKIKYDLVVVDSTDPIGPGEGLFTKDFYQNCFRILNDDGILVNQHESPYFDRTKKEMKRAHQKIKGLFPISMVYQAFIPTYPSGHWLFGFASKKYHPLNDLKKNIQTKNRIKTKYYNGELHSASFVLPNYVADELTNIKY